MSSPRRAASHQARPPGRPRRRTTLARAWAASSRRTSEAAWALATAALSGLLTVPVFRLWEADLGLPLRYGGDTNFYAMLVKGISDNGWYQHNPGLGAPFGQELYDFPVGADNLNVLALKLVALPSSSWAVTMNAFFLLGFALIAFASFLVLQAVRVSRGPALVCSVLFAYLPYHVLRAEGHLFLSSYWAVPLGAYLVLSTLGGTPLFARRRAAGRRALAYASERTVATLACCFAVASTGVYYAVFTLLLLVVAVPLGWIAARGRRPLVHGAVVVGAISAALLFNLAPNIVHRLAEGPNEVVTKRLPAETEYYSINLARMAMPLVYHRVDDLADAGNRYASTSPLPAAGEGTGYVGLVALAGFAWLVAVALAALASSGRSVGKPVERRAAGAALISFLIGTTGGFATLLAYTLTPELHGAGRIVVYIAFFAFVGIGTLLTRLDQRLGAGLVRRTALGVVLACVLALGLYDQTPNYHLAGYYDTLEQEFESDEQFVRGLERRVPRGSLVYQLPYVAFPHDGSVTGSLAEYDLLRGYLHSTTVRWSYGAMNARAENWQSALADLPVADQVVAVATCGFAGVYVDRRGYADGGAGAAEAELRRVLRTSPLVSRNGRLAFYPAESYVERLGGTGLGTRRCNLALRPLVVVFGHGFYGDEQSGAGERRWADRDARLVLLNAGDAPLEVRFRATVSTAYASPSSLEVQLPDSRKRRFTISSAGRPIDLRVRAEPGQTTLTFSTNAPQASAGDFRWLHMLFQEPHADVEGAAAPRAAASR